MELVSKKLSKNRFASCCTNSVVKPPVSQHSPVCVLVVYHQQGETAILVVGRSAAGDCPCSRHSCTCTKNHLMLENTSTANYSPNLSYNSNNFEVSVAKISSYVTLHNTDVQGSFNGAPHDQKCDT